MALESMENIENIKVQEPTLNLIIVQSQGMSPAQTQCVQFTTVNAAAVNIPTSKVSSTPTIKPAKKSRNEQSEILRCKRRLDFANLGYTLQKPQPVAVARRNERERNRVKLINMTFATLRDHLPNAVAGQQTSKSKKLSKVDTLRSAIEYIRSLQDMLDEHDAVESAFSSGCLSPALSQADSVGLASSPGCSSVSDTASEPPLTPDDEDLLDFTSWFQ